jgi:hypothetical protein
MTPEQVQQGVERIRKMQDDDESAHSAEDGLREQVLEAIAAGAPDAVTLAKEVLKTSEIHFARWCA